MALTIKVYDRIVESVSLTNALNLRIGAVWLNMCWDQLQASHEFKLSNMVIWFNQLVPDWNYWQHCHEMFFIQHPQGMKPKQLADFLCSPDPPPNYPVTQLLRNITQPWEHNRWPFCPYIRMMSSCTSIIGNTSKTGLIHHLSLFPESEEMRFIRWAHRVDP